MTRVIFYVMLAALTGASWFWYGKTGDRIAEKSALVEKIAEAGDPDGNQAALESEITGLEGQQTFNGILLTFLSAGLVGILFVVHILPTIAQFFTRSVYDSGEKVEEDVMHHARSLLAQGEYDAAIVEFRNAITAEPGNRMPWMEIAKIQREHLHDPQAAIETIRTAIETVAWQVNDAAYFMFRLAELYDEINGDRVTAAAIMQQVIDLYPNTRHSANANHKLVEWNKMGEGVGISRDRAAYRDQPNLAGNSGAGGVA
jgi:tetratricopeptide (TPR) repeat protein